jgi:transcriptional regulator with XRE-family HTH domain
MLRLEEIRKSKGFSRYKLSKLAGVKESTLQNIENSNNPNPTFTTMCKIADALGITLDELRRKQNE